MRASPPLTSSPARILKLTWIAGSYVTAIDRRVARMLGILRRGISATGWNGTFSTENETHAREAHRERQPRDEIPFRKIGHEDSRFSIFYSETRLVILRLRDSYECLLLPLLLVLPSPSGLRVHSVGRISQKSSRTQLLFPCGFIKF